MEISHVVGAILMLVSPALFALAYQLYQPDRALDVKDSSTRGLHITLWSITIACVGIWAGLFAGRPDPWLTGWSDFPRWLASGSRSERILWLLTFPLWFGMAMRFLVLYRPEPRPANPAGRARRSASLSSRQVVSPISAASWHFLWGIMGFSAIAVAAGVFLRQGVESSLSLTGAAFLLLLTLVPLTLARVAVRVALREPEPMAAGNSRELSDLYAVHRVAKVWGLYWIFLGLVTLLSIAAMCGVWAPSTAITLGAVVSVGGSAVGIGGAVFGIYMAEQRVQITRVRDREAEH